MMGDLLGSSRVSSQKQNREGVVGAQSRQYRATVVKRAWDVVDPGSGCDSKDSLIKRKKRNTMARNLENSTSENSNIQEMGPRRSTRLNVTISGVASPPREPLRWLPR